MGNPNRISHFVDEANSVLILRIVGDIPCDLFVGKLRELRAQGEAARIHNRLIDMRHFTGHFDFSGIEVYAKERSVAVTGSTPSSFVAIVSVDPLDRARLPTVRGLFPNDSLCHFFDYDEALDWLRRSASGGE